ncbi:hypothetical protein NIM87_04605 [Devosia sp. XJ19-1]|uniref:Conjugal transfer protein TraN n=1 Tax=Devosia ureilytica TaxID=2952754 RepID=A0A9Q4ANM1_9HYPH|nr:hypothetical protein [Devosia ureilytica]MCP8882769.1 hypothetical protein [Devosia ureilytica]MCP8886863.1 hypothetical protein [Devosia ureilytica]
MRAFNRRLGATGLVLILAAGLTMPAFAQDSAAVDFGDDTSEWANDGECDDPRFTGASMAAELEDVDISHDATDCRTAFEAGNITLAESATTEATPPVAAAPSTEIDFGDDTSNWANDGECDDPRFAGATMAAELEDIDTARDATDCRTAYEAGTITLVGDSDPSTLADIDFGDDTSEWAKDQECDDPRFAGSAMASELEDANIMRDASDCRQAFEDGTISLAQDSPQDPGISTVSSSVLQALAARIDFGDDSGGWPNDNECDDPDFVGPGVASDPSDTDRLKDASDCRAAFLAGEASLKSASDLGGVFDYGGDTSEWANDGQCDDWRFTGAGMAKKLSSVDVMGDASDCQALESTGEISIKPVYLPEHILGAPYDASGVYFGDNSSSYANDNICDDPRFEGPGSATTLLDSDLEKDAVDCQALYEQGKITLR